MVVERIKEQKNNRIKFKMRRVGKVADSSSEEGVLVEQWQSDKE
jgi:hypothetical protein